MTFVALDFETADPMKDSACAVALVRVEGKKVVERRHCLLRPPREEFWFTHIHGITWEKVEKELSFEEAWPGLLPMLEGVEFIAAHNAPFDRGVLRACCERAGLDSPSVPFLCTVRLARKVWNMHPTRLPDVCGRLRIPLRHHYAVSDAEACARIVLRAMREGGPGSLDGLVPARHGERTRTSGPAAPSAPRGR